MNDERPVKLLNVDIDMQTYLMEKYMIKALVLDLTSSEQNNYGLLERYKQLNNVLNQILVKAANYEPREDLYRLSIALMAKIENISNGYTED